MSLCLTPEKTVSGQFEIIVWDLTFWLQIFLLLTAMHTFSNIWLDFSEEEILAGNIDTAGVISSSSGEPHRGGSNSVAQPATDDGTDHSDGDK